MRLDQQELIGTDYKDFHFPLIPTGTTWTLAFWDTPRRPMMTQTSDSLQNLSQNETKSKLQIFKNSQILKFWNLREALHATHLLNLFDKMYKYEVDPTKTVGTTERTLDGRTDGQSLWMGGWVGGGGIINKPTCIIYGIYCARLIHDHFMWKLLTYDNSMIFYSPFLRPHRSGGGQAISHYLNQLWLVYFID